MILVDTSVWVDHLRHRVGALSELLESGLVLTHPFVIGELALGNLRQRKAILLSLTRLPRAVVAAEHEVLRFIDAHALSGTGVGLVDVHLLSAARLTAGSRLWTLDKRLAAAADRLSIAFDPPSG
jgi:predicted nucleic acid-binding protein